MKVVATGYLTDLFVSVSKKDSSREFYHAKFREFANDYNYLSVNLPTKEFPVGKCQLTINISQRFVGETNKVCYTSFDVCEITKL